MTGRPPKPTALHKLMGTYRADRHASRAGEPQPKRGTPARPALTAAQGEIWDGLCALLDGMGLLATADGWQLERYAVYFCRWRDCERFIAEQGMTYTVKAVAPKKYVAKLPDKKGEPERAVVAFKEHHQVKESHRLDKALKQIEANFGLTPSARARLTAPEQEEPAANAKVRFFAASAN